MNPQQCGHTDQSFKSLCSSFLEANPPGNSVADGLQQGSSHKAVFYRFIAGSMLIIVQECKVHCKRGV
jgi:hypothetical protein